MLQLLDKLLAEVLQLSDSALIQLDLLLHRDHVGHCSLVAIVDDRHAAVARDDGRRARSGSALAALASGAMRPRRIHALVPIVGV